MYIDNEYNINTYLRKFDPLQTIKFIIAKRSDNYYCLWTVSTEEKFKILLPLFTYEKAKQYINDDLIFIHKSGFTGACKSKESALILLTEIINEYRTKNKISWYTYISNIFLKLFEM